MIAQVAVSDCVYAIDRPYSYRIPDGLTLQPGMRVLVPFGNGNRKKEAVMLAVSAGEEAKLKSVEQALDEEPVLTAEQLRLAGFLRERYFCTYYDAVKAILPAGLWFRRQETFALTPEAADVPEDGSLAGQLVQFLRELGGSATDAALRQRFPDEEQLAQTIKTLKAKKMLTSSLDLTRRGGVKTQKLAALAVPAEDAMDFARRKQRAAPLQKAVLELLCAVGSGSAQEICELTGASMPTLRRLEKLELITISEQPVFRPAVRIDVKRQRVDDLVELACAVGVFVHNIDLPVDRPGDLVERHDVRSRRHPVEHDQLRAHQLVHDQLAHIGIITLECLRISKHDLLRDYPGIGRFHVEIRRLMHAVQLGHNALGIVLLAKVFEEFWAEFVIVRRLEIDVLARVTGEVIFLLALFEHEQERLLAGVEARIFQRLLNEFRLAGLQKAGEDIHWDLLHRLLLSAPCRTARPRPVRSASSRSRRCGP